MASSKLGKEEIGNLVDSICEQHGLQDQAHINFEDFCQILSPQMDKIWNAGLDWKGTLSLFDFPYLQMPKSNVIFRVCIWVFLNGTSC